MKLEIKKAVKHKLKARIALLGPAGSGKTWTALQIAKGLAPGGRYLVIDTERESACLYSDTFAFDVLPLETHSPETYVQALRMAADGGYDVVIVDSLSHAWSGREGALEQVDNKAAKLKGNSYVAWRDVTPMHNALVDALLTSPAHVIATMRVKMAYELVDGRDGKKVPQKIGLQPIQREGVEYEFTVVADIDTDHTLTVGKTRCAAVDGKTIRKPGPEFGATIRAWLDDGEAAPERPTRAVEVSAEEAPGVDPAEVAIVVSMLENAADQAAWKEAQTAWGPHRDASSADQRRTVEAAARAALARIKAAAKAQAEKEQEA